MNTTTSQFFPTKFSTGHRKLFVASFIFGASLSSLEAASKLSEIIDNATISGFAFTRISSLHGRDGEGTRWQWRFKPVVTTGAVNGWSGSVGIFFSKGSSVPDSNNTDGDIGASRGDVSETTVDRFSISDYYLTYNAKEQLGTDTIIIAGQKSPGTVFTDNVLDRAMGVFIQNKDISALNIGLQWWDTWMGDDIYFSPRGNMQNNAGIGNNVFLLSLGSGSDFTKQTGLDYNLTYAYGNRWFDFMLFGNIGYTAKFGNNSLGILIQGSSTRLTDNPHIFSNATTFSAIYQQTGPTGSNGYNFAKQRGMYNLRIDYKYHLSDSSAEDSDAPKSIGFVGFSIGTMGSFGPGYGTLIDNTGGLKLGGVLWNGYSGPEANGFGILGTGGFDKSWLYGGYLKAEMKYKKFGASLDVVYVATSHFYYLKKAGTDGTLNANGKLYTKENAIKKANFIEVSPTITYQVTPSISMAAYYGYLLGNPQFGRFRFLVNYVF
ncbi:major outer membrane protein [Helicobacter aurati]|uniref:Major outer membrane protein n=1 Tax=Helicobacter aurati TaxID=137778 RepID=A0A3D8J8A2_9HELI|nr:major outer membrane protein [Helicobacter aurati]RDU73104.1 major outer membrane protein [Helicobacter aurati]